MKKLLKNLKHGLIFFGQCVATVVNAALLLVVYALGVGLTALAAKLSGKHFLARHLDRERTTYWENIDQGKRSEDKYYRQF